MGVDSVQRLLKVESAVQELLYGSNKCEIQGPMQIFPSADVSFWPYFVRRPKLLKVLLSVVL
jgi:hypothetical protein